MVPRPTVTESSSRECDAVIAMDSLAWLYSRAARSHARLIARLFVLDRSATATAASKPAGGSETWHASTLRAEESDLWSLLAERLPAPLLDARIDGVPWEEYVAAVLLCVLLVSLVLPLSWRRALSRVRDGGKQTARGRRHQAARRHSSPVEPTSRERALSVQVEQLSVELARARSNKQSMISALEAQAESLSAELTRARQRAGGRRRRASSGDGRRRRRRTQRRRRRRRHLGLGGAAAMQTQRLVGQRCAPPRRARRAAAVHAALRSARQSPASAPGGSRRRSCAWGCGRRPQGRRRPEVQARQRGGRRSCPTRGGRRSPPTASRRCRRRARHPTRRPRAGAPPSSASSTSTRAGTSTSM